MCGFIFGKKIKILIRKKNNIVILCVYNYMICINIELEYNIILLLYNSKSPKRSWLPNDDVVVRELVEHSGSAASL